jgi:hypothetical protein
MDYRDHIALRWGFDAGKGGATPWIFTYCAFQKQHVEVDIQIERAAKTLNQRNSACFRLFIGKAAFANNVSRNSAVNNPYHLA